MKRGDVPAVGDVLRDIAALEAQIRDRLDGGRTPLAEDADLPAISAWSVSAHRRHWGW